ncbi:2Fe-2S iron-sulfur cluster-binding protein [Sphingomonas sp. BIUV-7]|uniref:2Fe-2S iron-sulfur cluster-binding protein n=1 Tax=Sphingomonas natans TaxID=3063330 RepID=A0ABT8YAB1_9SPHN|nr:2Fe-2S iron-sulfur cluster-binding protein [Sphingomonas sp. BIUV-7]MDO6415277.1 2Fe-2S iron-sulfur cluster-binding protein [Sphingomonas sp. BIUV-7]
MVFIEITDRQGNASSANGQVGGSLMDAICRSVASETFATCGGCLSCATCHVYIGPTSEGRLSPAGEEERDLLSALRFRNERSRLSCQVPIFADTPLWRVTIAPEE